MNATVVGDIILKCQKMNGLCDELDDALSCYNDMMEDMKAIDNRDTEVTDKLPWQYKYLLHSTDCIQLVVGKIYHGTNFLQTIAQELADYIKEHDIDY